MTTIQILPPVKYVQRKRKSWKKKQTGMERGKEKEAYYRIYNIKGSR